MIDEFTKFVSSGDVLRRENLAIGGSYNNYDVRPFYIGVNEFDGKILTGGTYDSLIDIYGNRYYSMNWSGGVLLPADLFYLGFEDMKEKGSSLYIPRKDRYKLFSGLQSYQKNDNTNDYLLSGQNAIGTTGTTRHYLVYDADRVTSTLSYETTSDFVSSLDYTTVDFSTWNNPEIYTSDSQGRFKNPSEVQIEIGYATYSVLMNEGEDDEYISRPQKYIDITFNESTGIWSWGAYSTFNEPIDLNFTMTNDEGDEVLLTFYMYTFKFQTAMCFDEGGVK